MKKTLSLILALLMSVSSASMIFADEAADVEPISAVTEEAPVEEAETDYDLAIDFLVNKRIMKGKEDGLRHAEHDVKRYEMAILTARVATGWTEDCDWMNGEADNTKFTDLAGSGAADALGAVSYANQKGIVVGYGDGTFKPENTVTYREALTMAVRTLGYTGLEYPWGFIEKAVSLGLTEDIVDVAYTAPINRGVAAQIIYNALFAKTASGETLAMKSFDCEYGWENIIVVADEIETYTEEVGVTAADKGVVAFKLVNNDGTFSEETFYVKKDLTVGAFYEALFESDADDELVDLIGAYPYIPETIWNYGITDNEKNEVTADNIKAYLEDYELVEKYNVKNLSKTTFYDDEIILRGVENIKLYKTDYSASKYAVDWLTGDILVKNADGEWVVDWYYNEIYETYFKWGNQVAEIADEKAVIGWNIMDADELQALKDAIKASYLVEDGSVDAYKLIDKPGYSAFAALEVYDLNGDDKGDFATYEKYVLGVYNGIKNYADACGDHDNDAIYFGDKPYTLEDSCSHYSAKGYTWAEGFEPSEGYTGWVIYGVNEAKNEVKIVKEIESGVDADSYVATGIVRGVNGAAKTVTIDNTKFSYDWKGLDGSDFSNIADGDRAKFSADFYNNLFYQFVEYVVVDGKIAAIDTKGATAKNYIVVERYLGVDTDGYIVIEGYTTDDLKLDTFRIGAFDGWKQGSAFFYEDVIDGEFVKGNVYQITSIDDTADNGDVYYVTAIAKADEWQGDTANGNNGSIGTVKPLQDFAIEDATITVEDNYRITTYVDADGKTQTKTKRLNDDQKYVIIGDVANYLGKYAPLFTFKGKLPADWEVTGDLIVADDNLYIICNVDYDKDFEGFWLDTYATGYVVLRNEYYKNVQFEGDSYYIYGAVEYEVEAFNLLTGKTDDYAVGTNLDLDTYEIYNTIDKTIVDDEAKDDWFDFWNEAKDLAYTDNNKDGDRDFVFAADWATKAQLTTDKRATISEEFVSGMLQLTGKYDDLLAADAKIYELELNSDDTVKAIGDFAWEAADDAKVYYYAILDVKNSTIVIYVNNAVVDNAPKSEDDTAKSNQVIEVQGDDKKAVNAYIGATATISKTTDDKVLTGVTIKGLTFNWFGKGTEDTHYAIDLDNYHFGDAGVCTIENWKAELASRVVTGKKVDEDFVTAEGSYEGTLVAETYDEKHEDEVVDCDLIQAVKFEFAAEDYVTVSDKDWKQIQVYFVANEKDEAGNVVPTKYLLTVAAKIVNGELVFDFDANGLNTIDKEAVDFVLRTEAK